MCLCSSVRYGDACGCGGLASRPRAVWCSVGAGTAPSVRCRRRRALVCLSASAWPRPEKVPATGTSPHRRWQLPSWGWGRVRRAAQHSSLLRRGRPLTPAGRDQRSVQAPPSGRTAFLRNPYQFCTKRTIKVNHPIK